MEVPGRAGRATASVVPCHICTAVNLARQPRVFAGGEVVEGWDLVASGANR